MRCSLSDHQAKLLAADFERVVVMLDGDGPGVAASLKIASRVARLVWVTIAEVPHGYQPDQLPSDAIGRILRPFYKPCS